MLPEHGTRESVLYLIMGLSSLQTVLNPFLILSNEPFSRSLRGGGGRFIVIFGLILSEEILFHSAVSISQWQMNLSEPGWAHVPEMLHLKG